MKREKTVTGAITPKLINERSERNGLLTLKNLLQIKDNNSEKIVYFNNVHQEHAYIRKWHAQKETILQNINQT